MPARRKAASKTAASDNGAGTPASSGDNGSGRGTRLVIVESPAKARTIAGYLGRGYVVESSIGHIRDMPDKAAEIPQKYRGEPWARLGVDVDHDFQALYVVPSDKKQQVSKLKTLLKDADELYLATDEDREGEAIAWHLLEELKPKVPARRMVFHEITPEAIARAVANPTELNYGKVDAYQTRRVLDRLYGYEVSPVLWKKVMPRLSAGRVQSVATRLIVDKERERIAFRSASYWDLEAEFATEEHGRERLPDSPTSESWYPQAPKHIAKRHRPNACPSSAPRCHRLPSLHRCRRQACPLERAVPSLTAPRPRCQQPQNGAIDHSRQVQAAPPSAEHSCDRRVQSTLPRKAGTSAAAPYALSGPGTASTNV